jgi:hypothetical protein
MKRLARPPLHALLGGLAAAVRGNLRGLGTELLEFRDRMRRAYHIAATVCLNMREGLARRKMAEALRLTANDLLVVPAKVARIALLYGPSLRALGGRSG